MLMGKSYFLARWRAAFGGIGMLAACLAAATPARAGTVTIEAEGTIPPVCTVTLQSGFAPGNFAAAGESTATAGVNCNTGFALQATSKNGAVVNTTSAPPGFINSLPYTFEFNLPLDQGGALSATCEAASMKLGQASCAIATGHGLSSDGKSAIGRIASLTASWAAPSGNPMAGNYSDTITISVAPTS
jgi:hypothetical protein